MLKFGRHLLSLIVLLSSCLLIKTNASIYEVDVVYDGTYSFLYGEVRFFRFDVFFLLCIVFY